MNSIGHPSMALRIANQKIDEQIRDAEVRTARIVRRKARSASDSDPVRRRPWRIRSRVRPTAS